MKKYLIRCILDILFVALFIACGDGFRYLLIDDTNSYTRTMMHQMYNPERNIDIIFVGSSHVYRSLVPSVTDEEFECYTFNAGSSSQYMDGSFAIIKEAVTYNDLKHIYLEMYYGVADGADYNKRTELTSTYIISDYMRPSLRKIIYLLKATPKDYWLSSFIPARRNWIKIFDGDYVKTLLGKKSSNEYKSYIVLPADGQTDYYVDRGYVANNNIVPEGTYWNNMAYGEISVNSLKGSDWEKSLVGIIKYCKKNNVKITLFVAPEPEWTLVGKGNYQEYHDYIQELANTNGIEYYDFNLCSNEYLDTNNGLYFIDAHHLNAYGAERFSRIFGEFFTGELDEEDLFYKTYEDKLNSENVMVYGIAGPEADVEIGIRNCYIISNRNVGIEYRLIATTKDGKQYYIQDFDKNIRFSLPISESGVLTVVWRSVDDMDFVNTFEVVY